MKFHENHGANITLDDLRQKATRISSFCDGIAFSDSPINVNSIVSLRIISNAHQWLGGIFVGVTLRNPTNFCETALPKHIIGMSNDEDIWIKPIPPQWSNCYITLQMTQNGTLEITPNNETKRPFMLDLPLSASLWLIFDIYGATTCVQFNTYQYPIPNDITALGPDVSTAFKCGENGIVPFNRTRIMIIGPTNSGKSSLKRALLNVSDNPTNDIGLDGNNFCSPNAEGDDWTCLNVANPTSLIYDLSDNELYRNLAQNIVKEIHLNDKEIDDSSSKWTSSKDIVKGVLKLSNRKIRKAYTKEVRQISDTNDIPDILIEMIDNLMKKNPKGSKNDDENINNNQLELSETNNSHTLDIWDFSGHYLYFLIHQIFLSPFAVYILVIDISEDLEAPLEVSNNDSIVTELQKGDLSTINTIHYWLSIIHSLVGQCSSPRNKDENDMEEISLQPKVIIIGTHRNSVHLEPVTRDQIIKETFDKIMKSIEEKPYAQHLHKTYLSYDCKEMSCDEPKLLSELRLLIQQIINEQKLVGFDIPVPWLEFEQIVERLKQRGIYFADVNQLHEVARSKIESFHSFETFKGALHFYHNQGVLLSLDHIGTFSSDLQEYYDCSVVILNPIWFLNCAYRLCKCVKSGGGDENSDATQCGVLSDRVINQMWSDVIEHKLLLIGCLEKLDIICELRPYITIEDPPDVTTSTMPKMYFFPWISQVLPAFEQMQHTDSIQEASFQLVIDIDNLPVGLFSRLLVRLSRWSWNQGWGRRPEMYNSEGRIAVEFDHDLVLKICLKYNKVFLMIIKIFDAIQADHNESFLCGPTSNVCVKVQHLIESEMENLRNTFYRRTTFKLVVPCPCDVTCEPHGVDGCNDVRCLHYLPLDECLTKRVVECNFTRQIRTMFVQRFFPHAPYNAGQSEDQMIENIRSSNENNWGQIFQIEPIWMRESAKLLAPNHPNRDWIALAKRLGYSDRDISKFIDDVTPCLALLRDWFDTNGRTRYCIDVLLSCLKMLSRDDVVNLIEYELEPEGSAPPVFLSYQWDSQEQVLELRRKLELAGFPCWMDVGAMGGGDSLYGKIYDGISRSKVVLCCLTPRFAASPLCAREVTLADVLHKPILPVILEPTPWPPPGPMAVIMSSIVYVDLCGVGGHGGIGKTGDSESRFREILDRVSRYIAGYIDAPLIAPQYLQIPDLFSPIRDSETHLTVSPNSTMRQETQYDQSHHQESRGAEASEVPNEESFVEDISDDSISILSNPNRRIHNRITNCAICTIF